jgi:hypothetical protein
VREVPPFDPSQAFGESSAKRDSPSALRDKVASFFKETPDKWIDGRVLSRIGGTYAWRTRVSECRLQLGMNIQNRQRRGKGHTISEYCYIPEEDMFSLEPPVDDATRSEG